MRSTLWQVVRSLNYVEVKVKKIFVFCSMFLVFNLAFADCVNLSLAGGWRRVDTHKVIITKMNGDPLALLKIPYCYVYSYSEVVLIKDYMCPYDKILVDDEACDVTSIEDLD